MAIFAIASTCVNRLFRAGPISLSDSGQDRGFSFSVSLRVRIAIQSDADDRSNISLQLHFTK